MMGYLSCPSRETEARRGGVGWGREAEGLTTRAEILGLLTPQAGYLLFTSHRPEAPLFLLPQPPCSPETELLFLMWFPTGFFLECSP